MFENIPSELRSLRQWICWRYQLIDGSEPPRFTKIPLNPHNGWNASVTVHEHWSDFDTAVRMSANCDGIGFVFTNRDPYCGIDLDAPKDGDFDSETAARQQKIFEAIPSYAERSPSGKGLHIICRASVPKGRKRASIEIYSTDRYFTFTGNVYNNAPIIEAQSVVMSLWNEMGPGADADAFYQGSMHRECFNDEMIDRCRSAVNGDLFERLYTGDMTGYPSQSEADQALMNIIAFHCDNRQQCIEIFRSSELGKREKAQRDAYMNYTLDKAYDLKLPPIDMTAIIANARAAIEKKAAEDLEAKTKAELRAMRDNQSDVILQKPAWLVSPPGLFTELTNYFLSQSIYPVHEISLTAVIAMLAGIVGKAYNVNGAGLNQYIMLLAETGRGKESMASGINRLMSAVAYNECPEIWQFMGPADIASGSALLKFLSQDDRIPCCVAITGEVGIRLQQLSSPNAHAGDSTLKRVLLDLYGKSGHGQTVRPMIYSDNKNNSGIINAPAFTWLGESTQVEFYKALNPEQIASGLIPRFLVIEYKGPRVKPNQAATQFPPTELVSKILSLTKLVMDVHQNQGKIDVQFAADAKQHADALQNRIDATMNANEDGPYVQLLNREYLKTIKLAAIVAVTHNFYTPMITIEMINWAYAIVQRGTSMLNDKFISGEISEDVPVDDYKQYKALVDILKKYVNGKYSCSADENRFRENFIISHVTLSRLSRPTSPFRKDKRGGKVALDAAINDCMSQALITQLPPRQAISQFGTEAKLYVIRINQLISLE